MHQSHYTFSVDDALQQAFNRAARQHNHDAAELLRGFMRGSMRAYIAQPDKTDNDALQSWIQALGGYHPAAEIEIEFERDRTLSRIIGFD